MKNEWNNIMKQDLKKKADAIMEEVNSDPTVRDEKAPSDLYDKVMNTIREDEKQEVYDQLSAEDREYLRMGKIYTKRRKRNRYVVLVAAIVALLALGTVSFGENKSLFGFVSRLFSGGDQVMIDSDEAEPILYVDENEVYEKIEEVYEFIPVRPVYLPHKTTFYEATFNQGIQSINMIYEMQDKSSLIYVIRPNFRDASFGTIVEDEKVQEYEIKVNDVDVMVTEYSISESGKQKWSFHFIHEDVLYMVRVSGISQEEVEKIVLNLDFAQE